MHKPNHGSASQHQQGSRDRQLPAGKHLQLLD
jgi:hypothetical protein